MHKGNLNAGICRDFSNVLTLKILYNFLVLSILEFGSLVWDPYEFYCVIAIEKVHMQVSILSSIWILSVVIPFWIRLLHDWVKFTCESSIISAVYLKKTHLWDGECSFGSVRHLVFCSSWLCSSSSLASRSMWRRFVNLCINMF